MSKTRKNFEDDDDIPKPSYKDALFVFELGTLPVDLKVADNIIVEFKKTAEAATTFVVRADSIESAAAKIDEFKNNNCGSGFTLAIFNLNSIDSLDEFQFLFRKDVLGNPRTIFVGTMRHMTGSVYTEARNKVIREDELKLGAPSCIDSYGAANRAEVPERIGKLAAAYLRDADERAKANRGGTSLVLQRTSPALEELYKIPTAFYGSRLKRK